MSCQGKPLSQKSWLQIALEGRVDEKYLLLGQCFPVMVVTLTEVKKKINSKQSNFGCCYQSVTESSHQSWGFIWSNNSVPIPVERRLPVGIQSVTVQLPQAPHTSPGSDDSSHISASSSSLPTQPLSALGSTRLEGSDGERGTHQLGQPWLSRGPACSQVGRARSLKLRSWPLRVCWVCFISPQ